VSREGRTRLAWLICYGAIAHATVGHKDRGNCRPEEFPDWRLQRESEAVPRRRSWQAELDEGTDPAFEKLEAAIKKVPQDSVCTSMPPVLTPAHHRHLPGRTRRGVRRCPIERSAASHGGTEWFTPISSSYGITAAFDDLREHPIFAEHHHASASGPLLLRRLDGRFPVRVEPPSSVSTRRSCQAVPGTGVARLRVVRPFGRPDLRRRTADNRLGLAPTSDHGADRDGMAERQLGRQSLCSAWRKRVRSCPCWRHRADPD